VPLLHSPAAGPLFQQPPNGQIHGTGSGWTGGAYSASTANHAFKAEATAPLENWRIFELWYGQKLSKELEVRIGKI